MMGQGRIPGKRQWLGVNSCCQNKQSWLQCTWYLWRDVLAAHSQPGSTAPGTRGWGSPNPIPGSVPGCCVSSCTWTYRVSPLEKECVDISQIPIKARRGLACFIISSSSKPFWALECGKWDQWSKHCYLSCQNHINTHIYLLCNLSHLLPCTRTFINYTLYTYTCRSC